MAYVFDPTSSNRLKKSCYGCPNCNSLDQNLFSSLGYFKDQKRKIYCLLTQDNKKEDILEGKYKYNIECNNCGMILSGVNVSQPYGLPNPEMKFDNKININDFLNKFEQYKLAKKFAKKYSINLELKKIISILERSEY